MSDYWQRRAEADAARGQLSDGKLIAEIGRFHNEAAERITKAARRIRTRFVRQYRLEKDQADALLAAPCGREAYLELLDAISELGEDNPKRAELLARAAAPAYAHRISVQEALADELEAVTARMAEREAQAIEAHLRGQMQQAASRVAYRTALEVRAGFQFVGLNERLIDTMIRNPWSGAQFSQRVWRNQAKLTELLNSTLRTGIATGQRPDEMASAIADDMGVSFTRARTLVRTEGTYARNQAELETYKELGIGQYRYLATLDMRTSKICQALDGQEFPVRDAQVGKNYPPMHPNCRSTTTTVIGEDERAHLKRLARDPVTGKDVHVPQDMTYPEWLKMQKETYGEERMEDARKMAQNRSRDEKQMAQYQAVLGKKHPFLKDVQAFQTMKYENAELYSFVKLDYARRSDLIEHPEKALPMGKQATAAEAKFTKYLFGKENPDGRAKGVAFDSRLGYNADNWEELRKEILSCADKFPATERYTDAFGTSYEQKIILYGLKGTPANIVVGYKYKDGKTWMATAIIKEV